MNTHKRVDEILEDRNMTLREMANICSIPYSTLRSSRRRGSQLSVDAIEQICDGLGITMAYFFEKPTPSQTRTV